MALHPFRGDQVIYKAGDKVEYTFGGYILFGTVTERAGRGYMVIGLTNQPIFVSEDNVIGRAG